MKRAGRMNRYSKRTSLSIHNSRVTVTVIAISAFVLLCVAASIAVGLLLGSKADSYDPSPKFDLPAVDYQSGNKTVQAVDAYAYDLGTNVKPYITRGITDLSTCLRHADGSLSYPSRIGADEALEEGKNLLSDCVEQIHDAGGRVCGYFYVTFMQEEDRYMRELCRAYELALINEAAKLGVDEILLICPEIEEDTVDLIERYVNDASIAAENAVLGVLISPEVLLLTDENLYYAPRIKKVCDFLALDLRGLSPDADQKVGEEDAETEDAAEAVALSSLESVLSETEYYLRAYSMRVVLSKENAVLYDSVKELGIENIQIVGE